MTVPEYDFEKLSREIVSSRLPEIKAAPAAAAEISKKILIAAITSTKVRQDPGTTVKAVCRGVIGGLFMIGKDLPPAVVSVMKVIADVSVETHQDPTEMMSWALEGVADVAVSAGSEACAAIQFELEDEFQGVGGVFREFCGKAAARSGR